jgi:hypothetical protein
MIARWTPLPFQLALAGLAGAAVLAIAAGHSPAADAAKAKAYSTTPPLILLRLPSTTPPAATSPIVASNPDKSTPVKAGDIIGTPCFSTVTPFDGVVDTQECHLLLYAYTSAGTQTTFPLFTAKVVGQKFSSLAAVQSFMFDSISSAAGKPSKDLDDMPYLGSLKGTMFGLPALQMAWGIDKNDPDVVQEDGTPMVTKEENNYIFALIPPKRYSAEGEQLTALLLQGYTVGFRDKMREYTQSLVSHFRLK